jgi:hypothetical protein
MKIVPPPRGQIAMRGERIYQDQLRRVLEPAHTGEIAVINVETGEYEVGKDHLTVSTRAAARWPGGLLYAVRVGAETLGHIGARFQHDPMLGFDM